MKRAIITDPCTWSPTVCSEALKELAQNNTVFPDIKRIIYNIGKKSYPKFDEDGKRIRKIGPDGKPIKQSKDPTKQLRDEEMFEMAEPVDVLATVVYFADDTKISVVNSVADGLRFEDHTLSNGSTVKVASRESKEMGLVYAIVKRLVTKYDKDGKPLDSATGRILNDHIKGSYDCVIEQAELKIARAKSKAEHEAKLNTAKPKKRYSIAETLTRINEMLDKADGPKAEGLLNKLYSIFKD
jgi:uncharacterized FlaG/YvyC family protein